MKFLLSWLKDYLEVSLHPKTLAERLTLAGLEVNSLTQVGKDWLFEAEVTPNRPDLLCHLGIARETAATLGRSFRYPIWLKKQQASLRSAGLDPKVTIEDTQGCLRYVGIVIEGVDIKPSPSELAQRLEQLGIRSVNNVVDVTNFCMMELGQPLHAFDLNQLQGEEIRVRRAKAGEKLITIDEDERELTSQMLVIADASRPVALAGVMGGKETEITTSTRRILLESAWFDPMMVRRASWKSKLASDSSYRFERGVDPATVAAAAHRATRMIVQLAGGKVQGVTDVDLGATSSKRTIRLNPKEAQQRLGMRIYPTQQKRFLERIGCTVRGTVRRFQVEPPSYRRDLKIPEDLHEELARLWGYERCEPTLPPMVRQGVRAVGQRVEDLWVGRSQQIKQLLAQAGLQEIQTYSLVSRESLVRCGLEAPEQPEQQTPTTALGIANPLSAEQAYLRPSSLPGTLEVISRNLRHKSAEQLTLFELGHSFDPQKKKATLGDHPAERRILTVTVAGTQTPLLELKGKLQFLLGRLGLAVETQIAKVDSPGLTGEGIQFRFNGQELGVAAQVDPNVCDRFEIPKEFPVAFAELTLEPIVEADFSPVRVAALPKVAPALRDLAVAVSETTPFEQIHQAIEQAGQPLLQAVTLFDLYQGKQVEKGKKSMAFRLSYSAGDRNLTDDEIAAAHQKIVKRLETDFKATLR